MPSGPRPRFVAASNPRGRGQRRGQSREPQVDLVRGPGGRRLRRDEGAISRRSSPHSSPSARSSSPEDLQEVRRYLAEGSGRRRRRSPSSTRRDSGRPTRSWKSLWRVAAGRREEPAPGPHPGLRRLRPPAEGRARRSRWESPGAQFRSSCGEGPLPRT